MSGGPAERVFDILLVEDNPGDIRLTREALKESRMPSRLFTARDGEEAMAFLSRSPGFSDVPRPHLVLLDLNLPKKNGSEVLKDMKEDVGLRSIPVIVMSTSGDPGDVSRSYRLHANCYVRKPVEMSTFQQVVEKIEDFWFAVAALPEA